MQTLFHGRVHVSYSQIYVESRVEDFFEDLTESRAGQVNGLCGAAVPGLLFLTTGLHTGEVEFTVEIHEDAPPLTDDWEDAVEVSFRPSTDNVVLVQWSGTRCWPIPLTVQDYRVRYCAVGMDVGRRKDTRLTGEPIDDRYLLQFWPGPPAPDRVLRQTSEIAGYWHGVARGVPTPEQRAEARRAALAEQRARAQPMRRPRVLARLPDVGRGVRTDHRSDAVRRDKRPRNDPLREIPMASVAARFDRKLVEALVAEDESTLRAVARWTARRAMIEAGLSTLDPVVRALDALDRGDDLPPPFHDFEVMWELLADDSVPTTTVVSWDGRHERVSQQHAALPALPAAAQADPLRAALEVIWHAGVTFGAGYPWLMAEIRAEFPHLEAPRGREEETSP